MISILYIQVILLYLSYYVPKIKNNINGLIHIVRIKLYILISIVSEIYNFFHRLIMFFSLMPQKFLGYLLYFIFVIDDVILHFIIQQYYFIYYFCPQ